MIGRISAHSSQDVDLMIEREASRLRFDREGEITAGIFIQQDFGHVGVANFQSFASPRVISKPCHARTDCYGGGAMRNLAILFVHLLATIAKLMCLGGARAVVAETLLIRQRP